MARPKRPQSKYASVVPGLPELPVDADWQAKIDVVKTKLLDLRGGSMTTSQLFAHYAMLRKMQDELKAQMSDVNIAIEATSQLLIDSHKRQEEGWGAYGAAPNCLTAVNGDKVRIDVEPYATVVDKDANREWAIKQGLERLLSLPWQTINSVAKKLLLAGEPEPPGVKTFKKLTIVYTPMKPDAPPEPIVEEWSPETDVTEADVRTPEFSIDEPF